METNKVAPEYGIVTRFFPEPEKQYGYIKTMSGEEIWFHFTNGRLVETGPNRPIFSDRSMTRPNDQDDYAFFAVPKRGDRVVFERSLSETSGKQKAFPWAYLTAWKGVEAAFEIVLGELLDMQIKGN